MTRVAVATALLLASAPASAWVRSRTSRGDELYWLEEQLVWHLDDAGSADLPEDDSELDAIRRSWATWDAVECDYGPFRMIFQEGPLMHAARAEYLPAGGNRNLLLWVDDEAWTHSKAVIGVTSATYDAQDGRILDTDIEFNDARFRFTTTDKFLSRRTDVQNTATHEIGHVLGLDHTQVEGATMVAHAEEGEIGKRDLHADDIAGLCMVVPPKGAPAGSGQYPMRGGSPGNEGGCALAPAGGTALPAFLLALLVTRARRRR